jgi:hypothetical protein
MIPTNKSEPKHLGIEGTRRARKSNENSSKKTQKSHELQEGDRRKLRSHHVSAGIEASRHAWILSPPVEPPVLVLLLNQVTQRFWGEPPQTPRADYGREPLPCTGSCPRLCLAFSFHHAART